MNDTVNIVVARTARSVAAMIALWRQRTFERTELASMTTAELRDAGLNAYDAQREAQKPFWQG